MPKAVALEVTGCKCIDETNERLRVAGVSVDMAILDGQWVVCLATSPIAEGVDAFRAGASGTFCPFCGNKLGRVLGRK